MKDEFVGPINIMRVLLSKEVCAQLWFLEVENSTFGS